MQSKFTSILLVFIASLITATAQIFFKFASESIAFSLPALLTNIPLIVGFALYPIAAILFVTALKNGELTVLYPILALNYIWIAIASPFFFPTDSLNILKIIGIAVVILGVYYVGKGMQHKMEVL